MVSHRSWGWCHSKYNPTEYSHTHDSRLTTQYSLPTFHYSLLTTHHPLPTTHYSLLTIHHPLPTTHYSPLTTHCSLLTTHHPLAVKVPRLLHALFDLKRREEKGSDLVNNLVKYEIELAMLEIYLDEVYNLLTPRAERRPLKVCTIVVSSM